MIIGMQTLEKQYTFFKILYKSQNSNNKIDLTVIFI